jgi:thiol-disulfide isomerase/thioredoxin
MRDAARLETDDEKNDRATRCLYVAEKHPGTVGGLSALFLAAHCAPNTISGKKAHEQVTRQIESADIGVLCKAYNGGVGGVWGALNNLAPAFLARARQSPEHPQAPRMLAEVCTMTKPNEGETPGAIYDEAANLIAEKYPSSPEIAHFCEGLRSGESWAVPYERHLRAILKVNKDRFVRCSAQFALANLVQATTEDRQAEAEALFKQFLAEFDGTHSYYGRRIEQGYIEQVKGQLVELQRRAVGMPVPEITGIDLDNKPLKLSAYRGRVVLLSFWGTWCFPCMKLVPHEIALAQKFQGQPFDIVGVNCDTDIQKARAAVNRTKMAWRSFCDQVDGKATITNEWEVSAYPCLYLIDHHGIIRKRWSGSPPIDELDHMAGLLVDAAQRKVPADGMKSIVAALPLPTKKRDVGGK